jgi:hypothetical protein
MTLAAIFEVAIMLTLTYLMLALMGSAFQEILAGVLRWRAKRLWAALAQLICDGAEPGSSAESLLERLRGHALINSSDAKHLPAYIPSRNFAAALIYLLSEGSQAPVFTAIHASVAKLPDTPVKQSMLVFLSRAGGDIDKLQLSIQTWFDDAMDHLSGDYKRWSQRFMLAFGLVAAIGLNADSLRMARVLRTEPADARAARVENIDKMRESLKPDLKPDLAAAASAPTASAAPAASPTPPAAASTNNSVSAVASQSPDPIMRGIELAGQLQSLQLPIGWVGIEKEFAGQSYLQTALICLRMVIGWIMTALAVSLGAPFWFDTLNRLFSLRAAGPKPPKSPAPQDLSRS